MNTTAVTWDEPHGFLWSIFSGCLKRLSNSSARLLSASPHRAVPKWLCLPFLVLHLLPRLVFYIQLSVSLPLFFCHRHLLAIVFLVFSFSLLCSPPVCLSQHTVCIHSTVKSTFMCTVALAISISVCIFSESYKHVCWLIHGARCPALEFGRGY